jgi:hypothetical protein
MRATQYLFAVICCAFAVTAGAENVGTTTGGGLKVGPKPKPKTTPAEQVLVPTHNDNSGAFGTKPKSPVIPKATPAEPPPRRSAVLTSGEATLPSMSVFDFDTGRISPRGDLFYNQRVDGRYIIPRNGATVTLLQRADFWQTEDDRLRKATYTERTINASDGAEGELRRGVLVAFRTKAGHFVKMRIVSLGRDLAFEWVTFR